MTRRPIITEESIPVRLEPDMPDRYNHLVPNIALCPLSHELRKEPDNPHCPRWCTYQCLDGWKTGNCRIRNAECNHLFKETYKQQTQIERLKRIRDSLGPVIDAERDQQNNLIRRLNI